MHRLFGNRLVRSARLISCRPLVGVTY